jgi:hypothetical protein
MEWVHTYLVPIVTIILSGALVYFTFVLAGATKKLYRSTKYYAEVTEKMRKVATLDIFERLIARIDLGFSNGNPTRALNLHFEILAIAFGKDSNQNKNDLVEVCGKLLKDVLKDIESK